MNAVLWVWRHHVLSPWLEDSVEEAVRTAHAISEGDDGFVECIETGGEVLNRDVIRASDAWAECEARELRVTPTELMTHQLQVRDPGGAWRTYSTYSTEDAATRTAVEFSEALTHERVRVLPL